MKKIWRVFTIIFLYATIVLSQDSIADLTKHFESVEKSEIMFLGTFHFNNPGLDAYKPEHTIDILSKEKQKELKEVIDAIVKYAPTKIAVEAKKINQIRIDSLYQAYLDGNFKLRENEIFQIGFRVAKILGHKKVYAIDAKARSYKSSLSEEERQKKEQFFVQKAGIEVVQREMDIDQKFNQLYKKEDLLKTKISLIDYFLLTNHPEMIRLSHGHYLIGTFKMGEENDYYGPDRAIFWYNRNLRIFHNLLSINQPGKDRIFVLIGAGHLPILNFLAESSVDFTKREFKEFVTKK